MIQPDELRNDLVALSPKQRQLLELLLRQEGGDPSCLPILPVERYEEIFPLTFGQLGIWLFDQAQPGSAAYNMPAAAWLRGRLDAGALADALNRVVDRHEALRVTFRLERGRPVQAVAPPRRHELARCDLSGLPAEQRHAAAEGLAAVEVARPFDLARGPLLRAALICVGAEEHLLVVTLHHVAGDRWSMTLLLREWEALYAAAQSGQPCALPQPPLQYVDFAVWQQLRLHGEPLQRQLAFWRRQLAGISALSLPSDRPRPAAPSGRGAQHVAALPSDVLWDLDRFCNPRGVSRFVALLVAFQALLQRSTDGERFGVGVPVAGRDRKETEGTVGLFVNTLVFAADLTGDPDFGAAVERVRKTAADAFAHQELPFDKLVEELRPIRDPRVHPLYQVMFSFQSQPVPRRFADLGLEPLEVHTGTCQVDLTLVIAPRREGLAACWEYSTDLFDPPRILRLAGHFGRLLAAALAQPDLPISQLPLLFEAERWQLLAEWSPRLPEPSAEICLHELFSARVRRGPDAVAVVADGEILTYGELDRRSNQLAHWLRAHGVRPEVRVAVCLEVGPDLFVALLAILKAGGVYVPVDPAYPEERIGFLLADSGARVLIARASLPLEPLEGIVTVLVDRDRERISRCPGTEPQGGATPESLAYLIYTSGSTGRPKGVGVCNGLAARHFEAWRRLCRLGTADRVLQFASPSFDASLEQILPALFAGARLVPRRAEVPSPEEFVAWAEREGLTVIHLPTVYWRQVAAVWAGAPAGTGRRVRLVNPGGDVMPPEAVDLFRRSPLAKARLINGYGPTEAIVTTAIYDLPHSGEEEPARVPIGRPVGGRAPYILDRRGELRPLGVPGELHVGGDLLARGYLGRPDLTAERFVPDPFGGLPGGRLYRTGDLVRHLPDGRLDFLGRIDDQVKVRGFRIEPGEIEAALRRLPEVRDAVVAVREERPGERRLVAWVVPRGAAPSAGTLRHALQRELPAHMVPAAFVVLDRLPLTASGKIDRRALPAPDAPAGDPGRDIVPPGTPAEEILARIWAETLGVARMSVDDDFFTLGGDSIVSLQVIAKAHLAGLRLTPSQFFRHPTIAELARVAVAAIPVQTHEPAAEGPVPLTPIQRWFFDQGFAQPGHWNQSTLLEIGTRLDGSRLRRIVSRILDRHEALRFRFLRAGEEWRQSVAPAGGEPPVTAADLSRLPADAQPAAVESLAAAVQASLDLSRGPLLQVLSIRRGPQAPDLLLIVAHHLVMDGVSWRILLDDLRCGFEQLEAGRDVELPPPSTPYRVWARRLADWATGEEPLRELPDWLAAADEAEDPLPAGSEAGEDTVATAAVLTCELDRGATRALLDAPGAYRARVEDLLLTALVQSFAELGGRPRLWLEMEGHGREDLFAGADLSRTIGWFTAKYHVLLDLSHLADTGSPGEALQEVKERIRRVPRRGIGFGVLRYLGPEAAVRRLAAVPVPAVHFNYLGRFGQAASPSWPVRVLAEAGGPECGPRNRLPQPLEIVAMILEDRLQVRWTFGPSRLDRTAMERLVAGFAAALRRLVAHCLALPAPRCTPSDFPLARLDQATLERLVPTLPGTLEDVYPLSPVQHGMLFHSLYAPGSGVYIEQLCCELAGLFDSGAFQQAWQRALDRHPSLRAAFVWRGLSQPVQVVCRSVDLALELIDWRQLPDGEQRERLETLLAEDRALGFDLERAPLMRLRVLRLADERWAFLWTVHHLLLDGWAEPLVLREVFSLYLAGWSRPVLPPRRPYRDYIEWLQAQDRAAAETFWRRTLCGFSRPTPLPADPGTADEESGDRHEEEEVSLTAELTAALQSLARQHGLTLNTLLAGAWALLLGHAAGVRDVVFGLTLSGRPSDLPGSDEMVGMFINTLPLRVLLPPDAGLAPWLKDLQARTAELLQHDSSSLVDVQGWSDVPRSQALFESIVVFMNQPRDYLRLREELERQGLQVVAVRGVEQTNYPLTLTAFTGESLHLQVNYRLQQLRRATVLALLEDLRRLLEAMPARPDATVGDLLGVLAALDRQRRSQETERLRDARREAFGRLRRRPGIAIPTADGRAASPPMPGRIS